MCGAVVGVFLQLPAGVSGDVCGWCVVGRVPFPGVAASSAALCRDGKSATPAERGRRFDEGPATAGGRGLSAGWPAVVEDARARSVGGSSSSRVRAWAVPFSAVLCRVLWFPCSRCSGLSAMRRLAVGRVRRARFRRKIVVALSLPPAMELSAWSLKMSTIVVSAIVAPSPKFRRKSYVLLYTMPSEVFIQFCKIFIEFNANAGQMPI